VISNQPEVAMSLETTGNFPVAVQPQILLERFVDVSQKLMGGAMAVGILNRLN
jgi:hypothetical protein